jgi:hypothetical protein
MKKILHPVFVITIFAVVLAAGIVFACAVIMPGNDLPETEEAAAEETIETPLPDNAEQTIKALAAAYPQIITRAEFRNNDWAILVNDTWYYYSESRMLPEALLPHAEEYARVGFMSSYQAELPPWTPPTAEQAERYRNRGRTNNNGNENRPRLLRYPFLQDLLRIHNRTEAESQIKSLRLFEKKINVHQDIIPLLSLIEQRIKEAAKLDPAVQTWINNIGEIHGWNWRNVAGSENLSRHSYGIAVDILPQSLDGKETYWQWAAQKGKEWWNVPPFFSSVRRPLPVCFLAVKRFRKNIYRYSVGVP